MTASRVGWVLRLSCLAMTTAWVTGCSQPGPFVKVQRLFIGKRWTDEVPGVVPPRQRIAEVRELGRQLASAQEPRRRELAQTLLNAFQSEDDPNIRWEIFRAFGDGRFPEGEALVELALRDQDPDLRIAACQRLGRWGGPEAVRRLGEVLAEDQSAQVRLAAIRALGRTRDPSAAAYLAQALENRDPAFQFQAMAALKQITGRDFGWDAERWRLYLSQIQVGVPGEPPRSPDIAQPATPSMHTWR